MRGAVAALGGQGLGGAGGHAAVPVQDRADAIAIICGRKPCRSQNRVRRAQLRADRPIIG